MDYKEEIKKLLDKCQSDVAKKHGLGDKLVTGHRKSYFDEATMLFLTKVAIFDATNV